MGLITGLLTLPLAPVRGVVWVAEQVQTQAEREWYDPERINRQLRELESARESGEISERECAELQDGLVARLVESGRRNVRR